MPVLPVVPAVYHQAMSERRTDLARYRDWPWQDRLAEVVRMMRDISRDTDPQVLSTRYGNWVRSLAGAEGFVAISRRDLLRPWYRITRSSRWTEPINPWREKHKLPLLDRGILGELLYAENAVILNDFRVDPADPAYEELRDYRSLQATPQFEDGVAINMAIALRREPTAFDPEQFPNTVWQANLFGRATKNLVLSEELRRAYDVVDRELKVVADIQRSLLPSKIPTHDRLELAAFYQTSTQAGGDYYDFFQLDDGKLGVLIADVSGHGSPAAVIMAVTHSIAHTRDVPPAPPAELLQFINERLAARYTGNGTFVTAFYGIFDPASGELTYCNAGHNPPRLRRSDGTIESLDQNHNLPLGIIPDETFRDGRARLGPGDVVLLYTDGITEARKPGDELFGVERLDALLDDDHTAPQRLIDHVVQAVNSFTDFAAPTDDRTIVAVKVK